MDILVCDTRNQLEYLQVDKGQGWEGTLANLRQEEVAAPMPELVNVQIPNPPGLYNVIPQPPQGWTTWSRNAPKVAVFDYLTSKQKNQTRISFLVQTNIYIVPCEHCTSSGSERMLGEIAFFAESPSRAIFSEKSKKSGGNIRHIWHYFLVF